MQATPMDLSPFTGYSWMVATSCSYRRILTDGGDPVIVPTKNPVDAHPDLSATHDDLALAATAPQLLVSTIQLLKCLEPAAGDFNESEQAAFDHAVATLKSIGAEHLLERELSPASE